MEGRCFCRGTLMMSMRNVLPSSRRVRSILHLQWTFMTILLTVGLMMWIYGHSHTNIDTEINGTKVVCNQLGYVQRGEHEYGFDGRKYIEL